MLCLTLCVSVSFLAQNLDKMKKSDKTKYLLQLAKEAVLTYGPDYYREYGQPEIQHGHVDEEVKRYFTEDELKKFPNRSYYTVKYYYNEKEEAFYEDYSAWVYIWGDTGQVFLIFFGNGLGLGDLDQPHTRTDPNRVRQMTWQKLPPGKNYVGTFKEEGK